MVIPAYCSTPQPDDLILVGKPLQITETPNGEVWFSAVKYNKNNLVVRLLVLFTSLHWLCGIMLIIVQDALYVLKERRNSRYYRWYWWEIRSSTSFTDKIIIDSASFQLRTNTHTRLTYKMYDKHHCAQVEACDSWTCINEYLAKPIRVKMKTWSLFSGHLSFRRYKRSRVLFPKYQPFLFSSLWRGTISFALNTFCVWPVKVTHFLET